MPNPYQRMNRERMNREQDSGDGLFPRKVFPRGGYVGKGQLPQPGPSSMPGWEFADNPTERLMRALAGHLITLNLPNIWRALSEDWQRTRTVRNAMAEDQRAWKPIHDTYGVQHMPEQPGMRAWQGRPALSDMQQIWMGSPYLGQPQPTPKSNPSPQSQQTRPMIPYRTMENPRAD